MLSDISEVLKRLFSREFPVNEVATYARFNGLRSIFIPGLTTLVGHSFIWLLQRMALLLFLTRQLNKPALND